MGLDWFLLVLVVAASMMFGSYIHIKRVYGRFSTVIAEQHWTGAQVARSLLDGEGLADVDVLQAKVPRTDWYDIAARTVNLTGANYNSGSIAAIGIAAHEAGHALQAHDSGRILLRMAIGSVRFASWCAIMALSLCFVGILSGWSNMWIAGNAVFLGALGCSLLALPVELNASRRGLKMLEKAGYLSDREMSYARTVLRAAAWSYVAVTGTALVGAVRDMIWRGDDRT